MDKVILLPIGSYEYHGELLPFDTDSIISTNVALSIGKKIKNSIVLPTINYGMSFEHSDFFLTATIDTCNYYNYINDVLNSISHPGYVIVIINAHGGNSHMLSVIESDYNYRHDNSKVYLPEIYGDLIYKMAKTFFGEFDSHAGSVEASLVSYYNGESDVKIVNNEQFIKPFSGVLRFFRNGDIGRTGVIKSTKTLKVDPAMGKKIHQEIVSEAVKNIEQMINNINKHINNEK